MGPVYYISTNVVHAPEAGRREGKGNYPPGSLKKGAQVMFVKNDPSPLKLLPCGQK
jgi:hypothetical protein